MMIEVTGNLWAFKRPEAKQTFRCITTNGTVKSNGRAVMGRGCAKEAAQRIPSLPRVLGKLIAEQGNRVHSLWPRVLLSFPVKHQWYEKADLELIRLSAQQLAERAKADPESDFILPRPGCGNGHRSWADVKPIIEFLPDNVLVITHG